MTSPTPPLLSLPSAPSAPQNLCKRFQGAIAGAVLGYLMGDHHSRMSPPFPLMQGLDWSGSSDPQVSSTPILNAMMIMLDFCITQGYACRYTDIQHLGAIPQSDTQAALVLLPLLLLHHDDSKKQHWAIAQVLSLWSAPASWENTLPILGTTLSTALQPTLDSSPPISPLSPSHSAMEQICHRFLRQPHHYDLGIMALINNRECPVVGMEDTPAMTALLGGLLGGYGGISALPLRWRCVLAQAKRPGEAIAPEPIDAVHTPLPPSDSPPTHLFPLDLLMPRTMQLAAVWSGVPLANLRNGNFPLASSMFPTVAAPRTLALD